MKTHKFLVFLRKMKMKKLRKSCQIYINHYLNLKDYDLSINTYSFNKYIFIQYAHFRSIDTFHSIDTFSVNRNLFIQ